MALAFTARPTVLRVQWPPANSALAYRVTYSATGSNMPITAVNAVLSPVYTVITGLTPETSYTVIVTLSLDGINYTAYLQDTVVLPAAASLTLPTAPLDLLVAAKYSSVPSASAPIGDRPILSSTQLILGDLSYQLDQSAVLYMPPADASGSSAQTITIALPDSSTDVLYSAQDATVTVNNMSYVVGDSFFAGTQLVSIQER
jgi:hypothetical protein